MTEVPEEITRLAQERERARRRHDFVRADEIRDRISDAGYVVTDTPDGPVLTTLQPNEGVRPSLLPRDVESVLDRPAAADVSVHWIVEGWPEDVLRGVHSFGRYRGEREVQHVVVDVTGDEGFEWPEAVELLRLRPSTGWGSARNAGLRRSAGRVVVVGDGSIEAAGDVLGPLLETLTDSTIGLTGPFGVVTDDLHEFRESEGPEVDAIEAYLMAFRRELLLEGVAFDERFRFYRSADIEFSFQVKARGLRTTVTPLPVLRHEHRMWESTPEDQRERLSKRNFYRFLDRWRGRTDLLARRGSRG